HRLQATGHSVVSIGKLHYRNTSDPTGFDEQIAPMHVTNGVGDIYGALRNEMPPKAACERLGKEFGPGDSAYLHYDTEITERACHWIESADESTDGPPWALFVSYISPHYPLIAPPEFYDMYPLDEVPVPEPFEADDPRLHPWVRAIRQGWPYDDYMDDEKRKMGIAAYFGMCSFMDANVGRVLDAVETSGLAENTRIVYVSDHGENLGKRGLWGKMTMYEEAAAVPLIIAGPDIPEGRVCGTPVSLADAYPTILECVGETLTEKEKAFPGDSWYGIASSPEDPDRVVFSEYHGAGAPSAAYMLRKGKFKYIHYLGYSPELFDLDSDPQEEVNLASHPGHDRLLQEFESILRKILDPEDADRRAKSAQAALVARFGGREAILKGGSFAGTPAPKV
ncbi:MAG: sulfatase-like hydrolase/transferase, partial [Nitrospinaceae bacterium]|nr:sulfatase-like hydrolase/transferase [Nitrospinaceae bacterium]